MEAGVREALTAVLVEVTTEFFESVAASEVAGHMPARARGLKRRRGVEESAKKSKTSKKEKKKKKRKKHKHRRSASDSDGGAPMLRDERGGAPTAAAAANQEEAGDWLSPQAEMAMLLEVSRDLQLQSLWIIPTEAVANTAMLLEACNEGDLSDVAGILRASADPDRLMRLVDEFGNTPLMVACWLQDVRRPPLSRSRRLG